MKKIISLVIVAALVLGVAGIVSWAIGVYNNLVAQQETVENAVGNVQAAYQQRMDLIQEVVGAVKNAANYEKETLTAVIEARAKATSTTIDAKNLSPEQLKAFQDAQDQMSSAFSRLLVSVEKYPELKVNQNFLDLHSKMEKCENTIANARRQFNELARGYNTYLRHFPNNIIANFMDFEKMPYFEASSDAQNAPNVNDLFNQ